MERCHEQRHPINASGLDGQQRDNIETGFRYCLCDRSCGRDDRLGVSLRLAHRQGRKMASGLAQIPDDVSDLCHPAADHDPERKIYFKRDQHRASPHFDFSKTQSNERSISRNTSGPRLRPIQGCALHSLIGSMLFPIKMRSDMTYPKLRLPALTRVDPLVLAPFLDDIVEPIEKLRASFRQRPA